jgi:hypothetical protein
MHVSTHIRTLMTVLALLMLCTPLTAQDYIVTTSGLRFKAKVIAVEEDSVKYVNKLDPTGMVLSVPKFQLRHIEYANGEFDYFQGSYNNLSPKDTTEFIIGMLGANNTVLVEAVVFSISNYFTENHFVIDFTDSFDSAFTAEKGRIEFEFQSLKDNFTMKSYKADDQRLYTKFVINSNTAKKRYKKLSSKHLEKITIYSGEANVSVTLSPENAEAIRKLFWNSRIH